MLSDDNNTKSRFRRKPFMLIVFAVAGLTCCVLIAGALAQRERDLATKAYFSQKNYQESVDHANKAIALDPNNRSGYAIRSYGYTRLHQYQKSIDDINRVLDIEPKTNNVNMLWFRGTVFDLMGKYQEGLLDFNKVIELAPKYADAYDGRASVYLNMKQYAKAINDCNTSIELRPKNGHTYHLRGLAYAQLGKNDLAAKDEAMAKQFGDQHF